MGEEKIIAQKKLSGETKYDVCFECLDRSGKDFKSIQPMFYVTTLEEKEVESPDGERYTKKFFDNHYFCPVCKKRFTVRDFEIRYTTRPDGTRWNEPPRGKDYVRN